MTTVHDFTVPDAAGTATPLGQYAGRDIAPDVEALL
jgi:hypothetical protein